jgi:hypothetical protein
MDLKASVTLRRRMNLALGWLKMVSSLACLVLQVASR